MVLLPTELQHWDTPRQLWEDAASLSLVVLALEKQGEKVNSVSQLTWQHCQRLMQAVIRAIISKYRACSNFLVLYCNVLAFNCKLWNSQIYFHLCLLSCGYKSSCCCLQEVCRGQLGPVSSEALFQLKDALESCILAKACSPDSICCW